MALCIHCKKESNLISGELGLCLECIRKDFNDVFGHIQETHQKVNREFSLPGNPPKDSHGVICALCVNECSIPKGGKGYCGLRENIDGVLVGPTKTKAALTYYHDNLPTNCVADWVCPGGTGCGYPQFSYEKGPEYGYKNLAVFYIGCSFSCLFCQNWHYRQDLRNPPSVTRDELLDAVDAHTSCICFFGGDPSPQLNHSIAFSRRALHSKKGRILRICWETNGSMNPTLLKEIMEIALISGGCIKFDLKSFDERLNITLCGVSNKRTLANFSHVAEYIERRKAPPILVASTLLVPGYIDKKEVFTIAQFIARLNPDIPYSLLGFAPNFYMSDLPRTSRAHAMECMEAAQNAGLRNVKIGNIHLLGSDY